MKRRLQNKVAQSAATLPTACVVATLLWWLPQGGYSTEYLLGWLACALAALLLAGLSSANALLRVRSQMVPALFLLLMAVCGFLHPLGHGLLCVLALGLSFLCLLRTYEQPRPEVSTLHAYLLLSIGSLLWAPLLLLTPIQLWNQGVFLRSLRWRSFGAAVIGLLLPYFFWAAAAFALGGLPPFINHAAAIIAPCTAPFAWQWVVELAQTTDWPGFCDGIRIGLAPTVENHVAELSALGLVIFLGLTGFVHYLTTSYDDKIRVRMCHYCLLTMQVAIGLWLALQPQHFALLFPLLLFCCVPAAAHFVALSRTWLSAAWFILLTLALVLVGLITLGGLPC